MKIEYHLLKKPDSVTLEAFADLHGLVMEVHERDTTETVMKFYAHFKHTDVRNGNLMVGGAIGNGKDAASAIESYKNKIAGKLLVINILSTRQEVMCPEKWASS